MILVLVVLILFHRIREIYISPVISFEKMISLEGKKTVFIAIGDKRISRIIERNIYNRLLYETRLKVEAKE